LIEDDVLIVAQRLARSPLINKEDRSVV
jgi:hypothetical protein